MSTNEKPKIKVARKLPVSTNAKVQVVRYGSPPNLLGRNKFDLRRNKSWFYFIKPPARIGVVFIFEKFF